MNYATVAVRDFWHGLIPRDCQAWRHCLDESRDVGSLASIPEYVRHAFQSADPRIATGDAVYEENPYHTPFKLRYNGAKLPENGAVCVGIVRCISQGLVYQ